MNFIRNLFGGAKEKAAESLITTLMGALVTPYQAAVQEYTKSKPEYVQIQDLKADLSPAGVDYLAAHLPNSFAAIFRGKDQTIVEFASQMVGGLQQQMPAGETGSAMLNPTLISLTKKVLEREVHRRSGLHR